MKINKDKKQQDNFASVDNAPREDHTGTEATQSTDEDTTKKNQASSAKDATAQKTLESLQRDLAETLKKLDEAEANWKRALADYKNLERRTIKEKEETAKFANYVLIAELIGVYDNLEMLKKHTDDAGLKMIADQFGEILQNAGLERLETEDAIFDESYMEAVDTQEGPGNKVMEEILPGYKFKDRLIRPAKVIVGKEKE